MTRMVEMVMKAVCSSAMAGTAVAMVLVAALPAAAQERGSHGRAASIEGTWLVRVQQRHCETQAPLGPAFNSVLTFVDDGSLVEATESPAFAIGQRLSAQGQWARLGGRRFRATMLALIAFDTPPNPPASPGFLRGAQIVSQTIELTGADEFASVAAIAFSDAAGVPYRSGCATAAARRFQ